jgi:hypothetical protein
LSLQNNKKNGFKKAVVNAQTIQRHGKPDLLVVIVYDFKITIVKCAI